MKYLDYYEIEIKSENKIFEVLPSEYSFAITDSIYDIFNKVTMEIHDQTGLLQEYLLTVNELPITVTFGDDNNIFKCDYIIINDLLSKIEIPGLLNGWLRLDLINGWYKEQEIKAIAYRKRISEIITKLTSAYFSQIDKNDTGNQGVWYQMLLTDSEFIKKVLLPNAYSNNANSTPFYCYITNDNIFHFRNANSMYNSSPVDSLFYVIDKEGQYKANSVFDVQRWRKNIEDYSNLYHRDIFKIDKSNGNLIQEKDKITDYPVEISKVLPLYARNDLITGYIDLDYKETDTGLIENKKGIKINSISNSIFLERMNLTLPFNSKLYSGACINLIIYMVTSEKEPMVKSANFSGKYVIERCTHVWNGKEQKGYTKIIIGRKYIDIPSTYLLKEKLIK